MTSSILKEFVLCTVALYNLSATIQRSLPLDKKKSLWIKLKRQKYLPCNGLSCVNKESPSFKFKLCHAILLWMICKVPLMFTHFYASLLIRFPKTAQYSQVVDKLMEKYPSLLNPEPDFAKVWYQLTYIISILKTNNNFQKHINSLHIVLMKKTVAFFRDKQINAWYQYTLQF